MSFILDALRKSDNERQQSAVPNINHIPAAAPRAHIPRWAIALIAGLALGVLLLGWGWLRSLSSEAPPMAARPSPTPPTAAPAASPVRNLAREARGPDSAPSAATVAPPQSGPPIERPSSSVAQVIETPPTMAEVRASGGSLPELTLELHVFSAAPQERFVFINSARYGEGDTLSEGARVLQITTDGVILNHGGRTFLLPRD